MAAKERQRRAVEELRQRYQARAMREKLFKRVQRMARVKSDKVDFAYAEQMRALAQKFGIVGKSGGQAEDVKKLSPMMQDRAQSLDRDLAANLNKYDPDRKVLRWEWKGEQYEASRQDVEAVTFVPMQFMDSIVATATWYGACQKGMKDYSGDEKNQPSLPITPLFGPKQLDTLSI